ncbi:putative metallophosphoesterase [Botrimarina colliarenosi]|uniref:Putative metallophosphoesterase n=1 Tax=Botrimarina colliarenosi TaxID=2528001 RepID=A0A5C6A7L8_9BACT|nr:metallophosphoesterase [Botrimarina colliarenosi]TWT96002.1 putative metallophosphoesterase [Botrimarina colliarenosi]
MQSVFWFLAFIGHGALWVELVNRLHGLGWNRKLIDFFTQLCGAACCGLPLVAAAILLLRSPGEAAPSWLVAYAWLSIAALAVVAVTRVGLHWDPSRDRRTKITRVVPVELHAKLGRGATRDRTLDRIATLPGNTLLRPQLEHLTVPLERLPKPLEGLRVAHLTDLHMSGRLTEAYFAELVDEVNAWRPDLVCVTGDIVEHTPQLEWVDTTLGRLESTLGSYFVLGNHDAKIDAAELRRRLAEAGLVDVGGLLAAVERQGETITLCGDERPWFVAEPPLTGAESLVLCLAHTPDRFGWAVRQSVDLVLAGHNHGGQVCFPAIGPLLCPSRHGVRYAAGTFRRGRTVMHVGRGSGSLFPLRYNCPPEVALLTLTKG